MAIEKAICGGLLYDNTQFTTEDRVLKIKADILGEGAVSPTIEVATNTSTEYTLTITDKDGSTTTPNLMGATGATGADGADGQSVTVVSLTQTAYDALSTPEKENGSLYVIVEA